MMPIDHKEIAQLMAQQISKKLLNGQNPAEGDLTTVFRDWIEQIVVAEDKQLIDEVTSLAFQEQDPSRRVGYLKIAKRIQARLPRPSAIPASAAAENDGSTAYFANENSQS